MVNHYDRVVKVSLWNDADVNTGATPGGNALPIASDFLDRLVRDLI